MSPAYMCRKGSLPLALMKSATALRPITVPRLYQRRHLPGLPSHSRSLTSPRCHPSTAVRRCRRNSESLGDCLRRPGVGPSASAGRRAGTARRRRRSRWWPTARTGRRSQGCGVAARPEAAPKASLTAAGGSGPRRSPRLRATARPSVVANDRTHRRLLTLAPEPADRHRSPRSTISHRRCAPACWRAPPRRSFSCKGRSCAPAAPSPNPAVRRCGRPRA